MLLEPVLLKVLFCVRFPPDNITDLLQSRMHQQFFVLHTIQNLTQI